MSSFLSNLSVNVPPKARIVLGLSAVAAAGSIIAFFNMYGGSTKESNVDIPGQAVLINSPNEKDIPKTKPGDKILLPDDSPISAKIEESRQEEISDAKKKGGGFADRLDFANSKRVIVKTGEELGTDVYVEGLGSVDNELNTRKAIEDEKKRLAIIQRKRAKSKLTAKQRKSVESSEKASLLENSKFLEIELSKVYDNNKYTGYIANTTVKYEAANSGYNAHGNKLTQEAGSSISLAQRSSGTVADTYINKYTRNPSSMPKVNAAQLNKFRGLADANGVNLPNGYQGNNNASSYQELVSPMGTTQEQGLTKINIGEMYYGILQIGVNTDEIGPVRAIIPGEGKLHESILVGEPVRVGEKISIKFSALSKDNKDTGVVAIALDPDTLRPALADNIDRHIFDRYFKLALAAAADGYVDALTGSTTTTYSDGSSQNIIDKLPDASDQIAVAFGKVGEVLIPKFENNFDRAPTVELNSNRDIIIMFLQSFEI